MALWTWFTRRPAAGEARRTLNPQPAALQPVVVSARPVEPPAAAPQAGLAQCLLHALPATGLPRDPRGAVSCLVAIDTVLREPELHERWLPRAASLVPQLMRLLRQPAVNQVELAERVARDVLLSAEVLRSASGARYAGRGPVRDLRDALDRLGRHGLDQAMARVVLRPVLSPEGDEQLAPLQALLQQHAEWQADALAVAAAAHGVDAFDGFLAGLLHGAGWQALLRIVTQAQAWPAAPTESGAAEPVAAQLAAQLAERAHRLFGMAARHWSLSPGFQAFARAADEGQRLEPLTQAWIRLQADSPLLQSPS